MDLQEIEITIHDDDRSEIEEMANLFSADIADLGGRMEFAEAGSTHSADGSKSGAELDWNTILVSLFASGGAVVALINLINARLNQSTTLKIKIGKKELEFKGKLTSEAKNLIEETMNLRK